MSVFSGDSLCSLHKAVEQKESSRQQLREQLDAVERETRAKLLEIDAFNTQLKVNILKWGGRGIPANLEHAEHIWKK